MSRDAAPALRPPEGKRQAPAAWIRVLRTLGLAGGIVFLLGLGTVLFFEDSFIYFPRKEGVGPSPGEELFLTGADGTRIHAWYLSHPEARLSILFFHGNAGNLEDRREMVLSLRELPANVLAIDYRGYGKSSGGPSETGLYQDARAAYDWLSGRTSPDRIVLLGKSLGSAPACELASELPCGGLILQSAFTRAPDMAGRVLPFFPARFFMHTKMDNLAKVSRIACPKLFIHSRSDEMIPFEMAERLFAHAAPPKESAWFDGVGHNDLVIGHPRAYYGRLGEFLRGLAKRAGEP
jgi:fermentation-respiration switch protein FrsA (DUF1100 family)